MARHHRHKNHRGYHNEHEPSHDSSTKGSSGYNNRGEKAASSGDKYGVWSGTPTSYSGQTLEQDKSPHITLKFTSGGQSVEANINVASTSTDTDLIYWINKSWTHPLTSTLTGLSSGFHEATTTDGTGLSLDFIRTSPALLDFAAGELVQDSSTSTSNNILSLVEPIIKDAIAGKANVFIFGRDYGTGIDDVHMNQGNTGDYSNGVGIDGALIFQFTSGTPHFEALFFAFATQEIPTDDSTGAPTSSAKALDTIAKGTASS